VMNKLVAAVGSMGADVGVAVAGTMGADVDVIVAGSVGADVGVAVAGSKLVFRATQALPPQLMSATAVRITPDASL